MRLQGLAPTFVARRDDFTSDIGLADDTPVTVAFRHGRNDLCGKLAMRSSAPTQIGDGFVRAAVAVKSPPPGRARQLGAPRWIYAKIRSCPAKWCS
jgi:hypothetical protein